MGAAGSARTNNAPSINKGIKSFALLSLLAAIINIRFTNLFRNNGNGNGIQDGSHGNIDFHPQPIKNTTTDNDRFNHECFMARNDTVSLSKYGKLKPPFINLGFPKMGTSSIHSFFACSGYRTMHYRCVRYQQETDVTCAACIKQSIEEGNNANPFAKCGKADVYSQLDNGSWGQFPQVEYLEEIVGGIPNGTFFLTFRSMHKWYHSITHWPPENGEFGPHMSDGLRLANITGFPSGMGNSLEEFSDWYCRHVQRVRNLVAKNPSQTLVEIDIEDPTVNSYMADIFDVDASCWGHQNVNAKLHPEHDANQSKPEMPWFVHGKTCIRGKNSKMRMRNTDPLPVVPGMPAWLFMVNDTCST